MTFTYKLARRLAILQVAGLAALAPLAGCGTEDQSLLSGPTQDSMARVSADRLMITPDSVTIEAGQRSTFVAYSISKRDSTPVTVEWSATGGTITQDGKFTSAAPGKYRVIGKKGRNRWSSSSDTSVVLVVAPVANIARLILSPDSVALAPGGQYTFSAQAKLTDSTTTPIGVTWTATGGTVDASGAYVAGSTPGSYRVIAATPSGTVADTSTITITGVTPPVPAQVVLVPSSVTLASAARQQFRAYARTAAGDSIAVAVTYAGTGGSITTTGLYSAGTTAGAYRVVATLTGGTLADTSAVTITVPADTAPTPPTEPPPAGSHAGWYTAPNGSSSAAGTASAPWSLSYALTGAGGRIAPGDTVWVRGGTYNLGVFTATLAGTSAAPVIVRQYPGERATLDMSLNVKGGYVWYWGMEVQQITTPGTNLQCFNTLAPGVRIINAVVHDCSGDGIGLWVEAPNSEATGNVMYNNGRQGQDASRYGHGIYFQNATGTKLLRQNVVMNTFSHAFHGYVGSTSHVNETLEDNVAFNAGAFVSYGGREFLVGGGTAVQNLTFRRNIAHRVEEPAQTSVGYYAGANNPAGSTVTDNYMTGRFEVHHFAGLTVTGNTAIAWGDEPNALVRDKGAGPWTWNGNTYFRNGRNTGIPFATWDASYVTRDFPGWKSSTGFDAASAYSTGAPTGQKITVIKNPYEPGRAVIVVWNWSNAGSATVDLSGVLGAGQAYEVRNTQRIWDAPVASGSGGGTVTLPLASVTPYAPFGGREARPAASTGTLFQVFLAVPK